MKALLLRAAAVFLFTIGICHANETQLKNPSTATMETIVVTAGRVEEQKKEVIANVTVIDEQEIRQSSARDLGDLLAQKEIAVRKHPGNLTTIGIRGFRTDSHGNDLKGHVLILLNGRRASTGNVAKIMTKNVERIEIIRGPASVQYGSAAMGGVVNVITRQGEGKPSVFAEGYLGSFGYKEISAGLAGAYKGFDFSGSVTKESVDDYTTANGDKYHNTGTDDRKNLSLNLGYEFLPNNRIGFLYNGFEVEGAGSPSYLSQNDLDDYTDKSNYSYDVVLDGQTTDAFFL
ncbi:MAG: TonB-dependent receptor [Desulfobacula sp.]|nr:TonB-dependent receptor [Desulfobacula sp.]